MPPSPAIQSVPAEFDVRVRGAGFTMRGWDFTRTEIGNALQEHRLLNPAMELCSNICPWNCAFCFTESPDNVLGRKLRLPGELSLAQRLDVIDQAADLGARTINLVGAGEPTIDSNFFAILEKMAQRAIVPIVYTEAALRLRDRSFASRLFDLGATVVVKMNSLADENFQNEVVAGVGGVKFGNPRSADYFKWRQVALDVLMDLGFHRSEPTRLAFDTIVCRRNQAEIPALHRFTRANNIFAMFVGYMPTGRSSDKQFDALTMAELREVFAHLAEIDKSEFGFEHSTRFPYSGGVPCSMRGLGLFVKITGAVFDCPGSLVALGDVTTGCLADAWEAARPISRGFDGGCLPRELFWRRHGETPVITRGN